MPAVPEFRLHRRRLLAAEHSDPTRRSGSVADPSAGLSATRPAPGTSDANTDRNAERNGQFRRSTAQSASEPAVPI